MQVSCGPVPTFVIGWASAASPHREASCNHEDENAEQHHQAVQQGLHVYRCLLMLLLLLCYPSFSNVGCCLFEAMLLQRVLVVAEECTTALDWREHSASSTAEEVESIIKLSTHVDSTAHTLFCIDSDAKLSPWALEALSVLEILRVGADSLDLQVLRVFGEPRGIGSTEGDFELEWLPEFLQSRVQPELVG